MWCWVVVAALVAVGAGVAAAYLLTRPMPKKKRRR